MKLYKEQVAKYEPDADVDDGIVALRLDDRGAAREDARARSKELEPARGDGGGAHARRT